MARVKTPGKKRVNTKRPRKPLKPKAKVKAEEVMRKKRRYKPGGLSPLISCLPALPQAALA
jgi:hypothetical protein